MENENSQMKVKLEEEIRKRVEAETLILSLKAKLEEKEIDMGIFENEKRYYKEKAEHLERKLKLINVQSDK